MNTCADMGGSANAGLESDSPVTKAMAVLPDANIRRLADYAIHYCYKENTKVLTRAQVKVIVKFLGEP